MTAATLGRADRHHPSNRWLYLGVAVLLSVAVALQIVRDRIWMPFQPPAGLMWLSAGPLATHLALGFDNLLADVYWMRAVVYYGGIRRVEGASVRNYDQLFPLLEMTTTLDPTFKVAYRFGAIFLAEAYPNGPGRPDQAIDLLQRAMARQPTAWEYPYDTAFIYYWWLRDNQTAAAWFTKAAAMPGAPAWLTPLAATTLVEGGDRHLARQMWQQMRDASDVDWIRHSAELRLLQLDTLDVIDRLGEAIAHFTRQAGRPPASWNELVAARLLPATPLDATGVPFTLDPVTGGVDVANTSMLWPLPTQHQRRQP